MIILELFDFNEEAFEKSLHNLHLCTGQY